MEDPDYRSLLHAFDHLPCRASRVQGQHLLPDPRLGENALKDLELSRFSGFSLRRAIDPDLAYIVGPTKRGEEALDFAPGQPSRTKRVQTERRTEIVILAVRRRQLPLKGAGSLGDRDDDDASLPRLREHCSGVAVLIEVAVGVDEKRLGASPRAQP